MKLSVSFSGTSAAFFYNNAPCSCVSFCVVSVVAISAYLWGFQNFYQVWLIINHHNRPSDNAVDAPLPPIIMLYGAHMYVSTYSYCVYATYKLYLHLTSTTKVKKQNFRTFHELWEQRLMQDIGDTLTLIESKADCTWLTVLTTVLLKPFSLLAYNYFESKAIESVESMK